MVATMALGAIAWKACEFESHYPHIGRWQIFNVLMKVAVRDG